MVVAGVALSGVAVAAWPHSTSVSAVPAPSATVSAADRADAATRADRDAARPSLSASPSSKPSAKPSAKASAKPSAESSSKPSSKPSATSQTGTSASKSSTSKPSTSKPSTSKSATSKSSSDSQADAQPELDVTGTRYATASLNLRTAASSSADVVDVVETGSKLAVTDTVSRGYRLVDSGGKPRWVTNEYLSASKPKPEAESTGISGAACSKGSAMESGLTSDAIRVHRAVCARFPQVSSFGGVRSGDGGFHGSGQAVDCMISDSSVGWEIARWVRANAKQLGVSEVIYSQQIWTVQRSGEGWRGMSDRGSASANHYDHVHVSVYGNSGTA